MYYYIEPEVSGGFGDNTQLDTSVHPPAVLKLHIVFDGWLGDDILETFPCFIVSQALKVSIESAGLTGYDFDSVEVSRSEEFKDLYSNKNLPDFHWLRVHGKAGHDDFGICTDKRLVISGKVKGLLENHQIENADLESF